MDIEITDLRFNKFAIVLDNVFTKEECDSFIQLSEGIPEQYELAKVCFDDEDIVDTSYRNNQRWLHFNKDLADSFFQKLKPFIPIEFEGNYVSCLNERLSFLKYSVGEYFKPHEDGYYIRSDNSEMSYITVQIYLNDLNEDDGGATTFIDQHYSVIPKVGRVLLFEHDIEHEGSVLHNGLKYCIRTDVMYSMEN